MPRRPVHQHDAGRDLVDVLAPLAARVDERFVEILGAHAQAGEAFLQLAGLISVQRHDAVTGRRSSGA